MKRLALSTLAAAAVSIGTVGIVAPPASALVNVCSAAASPGCTTFFDGYRSYVETISSKVGSPASQICGYLTGTSGNVAGGCASDALSGRWCNTSGLMAYGRHYGSSSAWTVDGRDATASDALGC